MVSGVEAAIQGSVFVHDTVKPVLPRIDQAERDAQSKQGPAVVVAKPQKRVRHKAGKVLVLDVPHLVQFVASDRLRVKAVNHVAKECLHNVLEQHIHQDFFERGLVARLFFFAWVDSVLFRKLVDVDDVPESAVSPVGNDWGHKSQDAVGDSSNEVRFGR